jgi:hypothetical protein
MVHLPSHSTAGQLQRSVWPGWKPQLFNAVIFSLHFTLLLVPADSYTPVKSQFWVTPNSLQGRQGSPSTALSLLINFYFVIMTTLG